MQTHTRSQKTQHQFSLLRFRKKSIPKSHHPVNPCIKEFRGGTVTDSRLEEA